MEFYHVSTLLFRDPVWLCSLWLRVVCLHHHPLIKETDWLTKLLYSRHRNNEIIYEIYINTHELLQPSIIKLCLFSSLHIYLCINGSFYIYSKIQISSFSKKEKHSALIRLAIKIDFTVGKLLMRFRVICGRAYDKRIC